MRLKRFAVDILVLTAIVSVLYGLWKASPPMMYVAAGIVALIVAIGVQLHERSRRNH